jgi:hypothetical protein
MHEPQEESRPPQPSGGLPQTAPRAAQVVGVHLHWLLVHTSGLRHVPHWIVFPHPSLADPQVKPWPLHVLGVQPQTFCMGVEPPPHVAGAVHVPHDNRPPQPSDT